MAILIRNNGATEILRPINGEVFELKQLQSIVEGYIECVALDHDRIMIMNEDGKYLPALRNRYNEKASILLRAAGGLPDDFVVGDVLIVTKKEMGQEQDL